MSTIKISELATSAISLTDFFAKADASGLANKNTVQGLSNFLNTVGTLAYRGVLLAADAAVTLDGIYVAGDAGTYTNNGGLVITVNDQIVLISITGSQTVFEKVEIPVSIVKDAIPTLGSTNPVESSGVFNDLQKLYEKNTFKYGFEGVDTNYTKGSTRINSIPITQDTTIDKLRVFGTTGAFKILELTRNVDLTFNLKSVVFDGRIITGETIFEFPHPNLLVNTVSKGSFLAFYSSNSASDGQISYATGGTGFSVAGELTGNNVTAASSGINANFFIEGKQISLETLKDEVTEIYEDKKVVLGNQLITDGSSSSINTVSLIDVTPLKDGYIKTANLLVTTAGQLTLLVYKKLSSGNFDFVKNLREIDVVVGFNNIAINDYVEQGHNIGFFSDTAKIAWKNDGLGYENAGFPTGLDIVFTATSKNFAINFDIEYFGLDKINKSIKTLSSDKVEGVVFTLKNSITSEYTNTGWSGSASPTVLNSFIKFTKPTSFDRWIGRCDVNLTDLNTVLLLCQDDGIYVTFDILNSKLKIHSGFNGDVTTAPAIKVEGVIDIGLTIGKDYIFEVEYDTVKTLYARIYNKVTTESFEISHITTGDSDLHGAGTAGLGLIHKGGTYIRGDFTQFTNQLTKPKLAIFGDSYIVGYNLIRYGFDSSLRYANLIKTALNNDVSISAKGGENSYGLINKLDTDLTILQPKYTAMFIGLNDDLITPYSTFTEFKVNMSTLINKIRQNGSIPILCTYPRLNGTGIASQFNSWVRNYSGELYVDFHIATSATEATGGTPDSSFFLADGHPNVIGNQRYFNKFKLDCPYLFKE
jgi:hypothetical protein